MKTIYISVIISDFCDVTQIKQEMNIQISPGKQDNLLHYL